MKHDPRTDKIEIRINELIENHGNLFMSTITCKGYAAVDVFDEDKARKILREFARYIKKNVQ